MSDPTQPRDRPIVFVSYAHEDTTFVTRLRAALERQGLDPRGDWLLKVGTGYEKRLEEDNIRSQALLFVLSPDSTHSKPCLEELRVAVEHKKTILPVLFRDVPDGELDTALRTPQWVYLRDGDSFDQGVADLVQAVSTDFQLMDEHGSLLIQARDWEQRAKGRGSLLRQDRLKAAELWLARAQADETKLPNPTPLQIEFIAASQRARDFTSRILLGASTTVAAILAVLLGIAIVQTLTAQEQTTLATTNAQKAETNAQEARRQRGDAVRNAQQAKKNADEASARRRDAERQTTIAEEQRRRADDRNLQLMSAYSDSDFRAGAAALRTSRSDEGVAYLARALVTSPANARAADRLFTLLTQREQPLALWRTPFRGDLRALAVSPDGERVAMAVTGGRILSASRNRDPVVASLPDIHPYFLLLPSAARLVAIGEDGAFVASRSEQAWKVEQRIPGRVVAHAFDRQQRRLAVASDNGVIWLADLSSNAPFGGFNAKADSPIRALAFGDDQTTVVVEGAHGVASYVAPDFHRTRPAKGEGTSASSNPDDERVVVGGNGLSAFTFHDPGGLGEAPFVDVTVADSMGSPPMQPRFELARAVDLDVDPEGSFAVVTLDNGFVHLLRLADRADIVLAHDGVFESTVDTRARAILTASRDGSVRIWSALDGRPLASPLEHRGRVAGVSIQPAFAAVASTDGVVTVWQTPGLGIPAAPRTSPAPADAGQSKKTYRRDGTSTLELTERDTPGGDGAVWELRRTGSSTPVAIYHHPLTENVKRPDGVWENYGIYPTTDAAISARGHVVVTTAGESQIYVWRIGSRSPTPWLMLGPTQFSKRFADRIIISEDERRVMVTYAEPASFHRATFGYVVYEIENGELLADVALGERQNVSDVSPDLTKVLIIEGNRAEVHDALEFDAHVKGFSGESLVKSATFDGPDRAISVFREGVMRVWDLTTGEALSEELVFNPRPPAFNRRADDDVYLVNLNQPVLSGDRRQVSIVDPESPSIQRSWAISLELGPDDARKLAQLAELIHGVHLNAASGLERTPQLSMAELRVWAEKTLKAGQPLARIASWLLADRESRPAVPPLP